MKTQTYKGRLVALLHKTSHGVSRIMDEGQQLLVDSRDLTPLFTAQPVIKHELTSGDIARLEAARGLVLGQPRQRNKHRPTVSHYNLAIKCGELMGALVTPVGT